MGRKTALRGRRASAPIGVVFRTPRQAYRNGPFFEGRLKAWPVPRREPLGNKTRTRKDGMIARGVSLILIK